MSRGRDRKTQSMDKYDKHDEYEKVVDLKALERFKRPAYSSSFVTGGIKTREQDIKGE